MSSSTEIQFEGALAHEDDRIRKHNPAVADAGLDSIESAPERVRTAVVLKALFHDAGKATRWFQERLENGSGPRDERSYHARFSAVLAHHLFKAGEVHHPDTEWLQWTTVLGVAKHHGNLGKNLEDIYNDIKTAASKDAIRDQLEAFDAPGFRQWLTRELDRFGIEATVPSFEPEAVLDSIQSCFPGFEGVPHETREDGFDFLLSFGALLGADKIHAAHPGWSFEPEGIGPGIVDAYKTEAFESPDKPIDVLRNEIAAEINATIEAHPDEDLYTLTAPTGSGKTLAGFRAALDLKQRKDGSRVVYCLPFTSVIDQNSEVLRKVLETNRIEPDSQTLLTHHHLTDLTYEIEDEFVKDGADLLVETWQSETVVTTFHQLVYTLFTSRNRNLKRISALENAVVLLDEVQAISYEYWDDVREMMELCADRLNTTFVLMTATMPLILPRHETVELLPSHEDRFEDLSRTQVENRTDEDRTVEALADELNRRSREDPDTSIIAILNRRKAVRQVYDLLEAPDDRETAMLSTDLTPKDRQRILGRFENSDDDEAENEPNTPFTLVTTQLIEAGVDISADTVIRDMAPLDSIVQSSGRCNRHNPSTTGTVELIRLVDDDGNPLTDHVYPPLLIGATEHVLDGRTSFEERAFHELARSYYEYLTDHGGQADVIEHLSGGSIDKLDDKEEGLQLIQDDYPRQPHFIIQGPEDREIWQRYQRVQDIDDPFKRRTAYREMRREFMERVVNYPANGDESREVLPVEPTEGIYHPAKGLLENKAGKSYEFI